MSKGRRRSITLSSGAMLWHFLNLKEKGNNHLSNRHEAKSRIDKNEQSTFTSKHNKNLSQLLNTHKTLVSYASVPATSGKAFGVVNSNDTHIWPTDMNELVGKVEHHQLRLQIHWESGAPSLATTPMSTGRIGGLQRQAPSPLEKWNASTTVEVSANCNAIPDKPQVQPTPLRAISMEGCGT